LVFESKWDKPILFNQVDKFGVFLYIPIKDTLGEIGCILHKGDEKNSVKDVYVNLEQFGEIWILQDSSQVFFENPFKRMSIY